MGSFITITDFLNIICSIFQSPETLKTMFIHSDCFEHTRTETHTHRQADSWTPLVCQTPIWMAVLSPSLPSREVGKINEDEGQTNTPILTYTLPHTAWKYFLILSHWFKFRTAFGVGVKSEVQVSLGVNGGRAGIRWQYERRGLKMCVDVFVVAEHEDKRLCLTLNDDWSERKSLIEDIRWWSCLPQQWRHLFLPSKRHSAAPIMFNPTGQLFYT